MKGLIVVVMLFFTLSLMGQNIINATVNSTNGLSLRSQPSLKSERITVISYKERVKVLSVTKKFDLISLSSVKEVLGEWKKVSYKKI